METKIWPAEQKIQHAKEEKEGKAIDRIRKRMIEDVQKKIKCCIRNDKLEKKQYIKKCESNTLKYNKKIRLQMCNTKCNYKRNESDTKCPLSKTGEDTTEHIMACQEGNNTCNLLDENKKYWEKIIAIYKNNKENREKIRTTKKCKRKRYTIEYQNNTTRKLKKLTQ